METEYKNSNCSCYKINFHSQYEEECKNIGRAQMLLEIEQAARDALSSLPCGAELERLSTAGQQVITRVSDLFVSAAGASKWNDEYIQSFTGEMAWIQRVIQLHVNFQMSRDNNLSASAKSKNCVKVYDDCIKTHNCDPSGWICLCCIPCSIKYSKCILSGGIQPGSIFDEPIIA